MCKRIVTLMVVGFVAAVTVPQVQGQHELPGDQIPYPPPRTCGEACYIECWCDALDSCVCVLVCPPPCPEPVPRYDLPLVPPDLDLPFDVESLLGTVLSRQPTPEARDALATALLSGFLEGDHEIVGDAIERVCVWVEVCVCADDVCECWMELWCPFRLAPVPDHLSDPAQMSETQSAGAGGGISDDQAGDLDSQTVLIGVPCVCWERCECDPPPSDSCVCWTECGPPGCRRFRDLIVHRAEHLTPALPE